MENKKERRKIGLESDLSDLERQISEARKAGTIEKGVSLRVIGMLGHMRNDKSNLTPQKMNTVGELYNITEHEMQHKYRFYKKKTWTKLNEILKGYGLPPLNLPQEYIADRQNP